MIKTLISMKISKKIFYYFLAFIIFIVIRFTLPKASNNELLFLSYPQNFIIQTLTGSTAEYSTEKGFFYPQYHINFDKSCAGSGFFALTFLMLSSLFIKHLHHHKQIITGFLATLILAYIFTLFSNSFRVITSIFLQENASRFLSDRPHYLIHGTTGILMDLTFFILIYLLMEKTLLYLTHQSNHEKSLTT